jgi:large subunit ribosomal protein L29
MKDTNELRKLSKEELQAELMALRKQQFNLRMKKANGSLEKTHIFLQVRRAIARVKTLVSEKGDYHGTH